MCAVRPIRCGRWCRPVSAAKPCWSRRRCRSASPGLLLQSRCRRLPRCPTDPPSGHRPRPTVPTPPQERPAAASVPHHPAADTRAPRIAVLQCIGGEHANLRRYEFADLHQRRVHLLHRLAQPVDGMQHRVQRRGRAVLLQHSAALHVVLCIRLIAPIVARSLGVLVISHCLLLCLGDALHLPLRAPCLHLWPERVVVHHGRCRPALEVLRAWLNAIATAWRWFFTTGPFGEPLCRSPLPHSCMTVLTFALPFGPRPAVDFAILLPPGHASSRRSSADVRTLSTAAISAAVSATA